MPELNPTDVQLQAYQGQANTAFPYYNLASNFQPLYGQIASGNQRNKCSGTTSDRRSRHTLTPYGGYGSEARSLHRYRLMAHRPRLWTGRTGWPAGATPTGMTLGGGAQLRSVARQFQVHQAAVGLIGYSPPQGSRIGFGETFNNPYADQFGPSQDPGEHPGTLSLNTTALGRLWSCGSARDSVS